VIVGGPKNGSSPGDPAQLFDGNLTDGQKVAQSPGDRFAWFP
jgi:hypothetical protein